MMCRGIEISIAVGVGEKVRVLCLGRFFFFCNHAFIVLGTKSLMQRELWRKQNP